MVVSTYTGAAPTATPPGTIYDQVLSDVSGDANSSCTYDNGSGSGSRTCTVNIDAPPTSSANPDDYFTFDTYETSPSISGGTYSTANRLATATVMDPITIDTANVISVTLGGIVNTVVFLPAVESTDGALNTTYRVGYTAFDAAGDAIVASNASGDPYVNPFGLTLNNTNGSSVSLQACDKTNNCTLSTESESSGYVLVTYTAATGAIALNDAVNVAPGDAIPGNGSNVTGTASVFSPIFLTNTALGASPSSSNGPKPAFAQNGGNAEPALNFTLAGQTATIAPSESSSTSYTAAAGSGCAKVATVSPSTGTSFTVSAGNSGGNGLCTMTFTDQYGGVATLDVTNTVTSSTINVSHHLEFVSDPGQQTAAIYDADENLAPLANVTGLGATSGITGIVSDGSGNFFLANDAAGSITEYTLNSAHTAYTSAPLPLSFTPSTFTPQGLAEDSAHDLWIANPGTGEIYKTSGGAGQYTINTGSLKLNSIAIDAAGSIYAASTGSNVIDEYSPTSGNNYNSPTINPTANTFTLPAGYTAVAVAVDQGGNVFASATNGSVSNIYVFQTGSPTTPIAVVSSANTPSASSCTSWAGLSVYSKNTSSPYDTVVAQCTAGSAGLHELTVSQGSIGESTTSGVGDATSSFVSL